MPSLADHHSNELVKLLVLGDAKTGKTGSLTSLVKAGYKIRVLDFDNLLEVLKYYVQRECPDKLGNVEYRTLRDKMKVTAAGPICDGTPKAFVNAMGMLDKWKYDNVDLGNPAEWGPDCVLVLDSLSRLSDSAYWFRDTLTPVGKSGEKDGRATYGDAQDAVETMLAMLTSPNFKTNVIVIAHIQYIDLTAGAKKGFPQTVGQKLSPRIPQYFPSIVQYENSKGKRTIRTISSPLVDLANPRPFDMPDSFDIENGLAEFFKVLQAPPQVAAKPKLVKP